MKSVKELLEQTNKPELNAPYVSKVDQRAGAAYPSEKDIPTTIILRRKGIRVFPDRQKIALYYSSSLDKYVSIPFDPAGKVAGIHLNEENDINEWVGPAVQLATRVGQAVASSRAGQAVAGAAASAGKTIYQGAKKFLGKLRGTKKVDPKFKNKSLKTRRRGGAVAGGAVGATLAGGGGGNDPVASAKDDAARLSGRKDHNFGNLNVGSRVSSPQSIVPGANSISLERQRNRQIWNYGSDPRTVNEGTMNVIEEIIKTNKTGIVSIGENNIEITPRIAKKLVNVYESLNKQNKKSFEGMLNESIDTLRKAINFCIKA